MILLKVIPPLTCVRDLHLPPNGCKWKMHYKCIMTTSLIIVLAISTSYLFVQNNKQNEMINNQLRYIEDLKSDIAVDSAPFSAKGILGTFFENNMFSFKNPWFDTNDIFANKRNQRGSQYSNQGTASCYNHISQNTTETEYIITAVLAGFTKPKLERF
jgi:hypothetical protein